MTRITPPRLSDIGRRWTSECHLARALLSTSPSSWPSPSSESDSLLTPPGQGCGPSSAISLCFGGFGRATPSMPTATTPTTSSIACWQRTQMIAVLVMAASLADGPSTSTTVFAAGYAIARLVLLALYWRVYRHVAETRRLVVGYLVGFGAAAVVWVASIFVPDPARFAVWAVALSIDLATPMGGEASAGDGASRRVAPPRALRVVRDPGSGRIARRGGGRSAATSGGRLLR